jgi:hypothetical protein
MRLKRMRRSAATVAVSLAAAGAVLGTVTAAQAAPRTPDKVYLVTCAGKGVMHPHTYTIACADGNDYLKSLFWGFWNSKAGGTGREEINTCKPDCASGHFRGYSVDTSLWRVRSWPHHPGKFQFTRLTLTYTGTVPRGFSKKRVIHLG